MPALTRAFTTGNPDILVATPGRLVHLLMEAKDFSLGKVEVLVFDEADRLFEMGFAAQLADIMARTPPHRQTLLFSATMPRGWVVASLWGWVRTGRQAGD
jgi:ATP-dependent RNA helicase DDX54/DBP10